MLSITKVFTDFLLPKISRLPKNWREMSAEQSSVNLFDPAMLHGASCIHNFATAFVYWWATPPEKRTILRISPSTATILQDVGLGFTPAKAPPSWGGEAIVIESTEGHKKPLVGDIWSITAYMHWSQTRQQNEICVAWMKGEAAGFASFHAGHGVEVATSTQESMDLLQDHPEIFDLSQYFADRGSVEHQADAIAALKMALAASYYVASDLPTVSVKAQPGLKGSGGSQGKTPLWRYQNLTIKPVYTTTEAPGPLDKDGKELAPVLVRPHIRMVGEKAIIIDMYASHRWKSVDGAPIATKKKI